MVNGDIAMDAKSKVSVQSSKQILQEYDTPVTFRLFHKSNKPNTLSRISSQLTHLII